MPRKRLSMVLGLAAVCAASTAAWFFGLAGTAAGQPAAPKVTIVNVTAGKPSELGFKLSKFSNLRAGTITFKVKNSGVVTHNFKICTTPTTSAAKNTCVGKATPMIASGKSATLTVTLKKIGKYEYLCAVPGHAGAGMKGLLGVGVKVAAAASAASKPSGSTSTGSSSSGTTTTGSGSNTAGNSTTTCASPKSTTVTVQEFEYGYNISPGAPYPCGSVTFNMSNSGGVSHDFIIEGLAAGAGHGALLSPGQSSTMTVSLTPGNYSYECDYLDHAELGMQGVFAVQ